MTTPGQSIDTLVFDCGDTLLHLVPSRAAIGRQVLMDLGLHFAEAEVEAAMRLADATHRHRSSEIAGDRSKRAEFYALLNGCIAMALGISDYSSAFSSGMLEAVAAKKNWQPFPGARSALKRLGQRYPLYVLANWDAKLEALLDAAGLRDAFQAVFSSEQLGSEKPELQVFERFIAKTGAVPARCVYVGNDYEPDVFGSRRAGFTPVLLDQARRYAAAVDCLRVTEYDALCDRLLAGDAITSAELGPALSRGGGSP